MTDAEVEDVDDVFEWVYWWWMLWIDEMDEEVDFRPRRPVARRYEERGVRGMGDGERDTRGAGLGLVVIEIRAR